MSVTEPCSEKIIKRIVGKTDMEDALQRLDRLTSDETRMATVQVLKATHAVDYRASGVVDTVVAVNDKVASVDNRVVDVDSRVRSVDDRVKSVDDRVRSVDDRVSTIREELMAISQQIDEVAQSEQLIFFSATSGASFILSGTRMQESLSKWLSPPDPTMNHNIACNVRLEGTSNWFLRSSTFKEWNSEGSLLWIYGKRIFVLPPSRIEC